MDRIRRVKWIIVPLSLLVMSCTTLAAEKTKLDLESAIQLAVDNDLELQISKLNLKNAELEYQKNKAQNLLAPSQYSQLAAEISLESGKINYQNSEYQIVTDTLTQYSNLWLGTQDLEIKRKNVDLQTRLLEEAEAQYAIGDIGVVDLLEQENDLGDAQFNLETAEDDYYQSMLEFRSTLGLDEADLVLADLTFRESWSITEEDALKKALENSVSLSLTKKEEQLAQVDLERADVSGAQLDRELRKIDFELAKLNTQQASTDIQNNTLKAYYQFRQAVKKIALIGEVLNEAQKKYDAAQDQYKAGLITQTELLEYESNLLQAEYDSSSAIVDYYLQEQALRQQINLEPGVFTNEITENK